jgi:hypothetical protein
LRLVDATLAAPPNLADKEPWLFDRASTFYVLWLRTGDPKHRAEALRLVPLYYASIDAAGLFMAPQATWYGDTKYSYVDPALWYEQETGDRQFRSKALAVWKFSVQYNPKAYAPRPALNSWTERHHNYALRASLAYWKLTGDAAALQDARDYAETVFTMSAETGAPLHGDGQHEGGDDTPGVRITSPWMGAMLVETMAAYGRETGDARVNPWVARYADFVAGECINDRTTANYTPAVAFGGGYDGYTWPAYLCGPNRYQWSDSGGWDDYQHSYDVSGLIAHGIAAKKALGQDATALFTAYANLRTSSLLTFNERATISPPRKFNWWFGATYDNSALVQ